MEQASTKQKVFLAVSYSFLAGANTVLGLAFLSRRHAEFLGFVFLIVALVFCGVAAKHARMLMKNGSPQ